MKQRVLIVDDHPLVRERLAQLINHEHDLEVSGEAADASEAMRILRSEPSDLVIVDITLKNSSGVELIKEIKSFSSAVPVLVLSMHDESLYAKRSLRAGASGYITKDLPADEILAAVRRVLAGDIYLSKKTASSFLKGLVGAGAKSSQSQIDRLTDRELEVLSLIGQGRTSREIADILKLGVATVDTYRARIKEKMNFRNANEMQHFAIRWVQKRE